MSGSETGVQSSSHPSCLACNIMTERVAAGSLAAHAS